MVAIVDYGIGNLGSHINIVKKVGYQKVVITADPFIIEKADKIILSGVGAFDNGVRHLKEKNIWNCLNEVALVKQIPVLGICLGMQLLTKSSEEGELNGLGWIDADVIKFTPNSESRKIPHMGWNTINIKLNSPIINGLDDFETRFYFVHSYYVKCYDQSNIIAITSYCNEFVSILQKENIFGVQFHPEKSHFFGMKLYKNFLNV